MFFLQDWSIKVARRNGQAAKAGRLSVFLPFRQGEADRTGKTRDLRDPVLGAGSRLRHHGTKKPRGAGMKKAGDRSPAPS
jgi:hypothetical protein